MIRPLHLTVFACAVFIVVFVLFLPAKSALSFVSLPSALSYSSVHGSIWSLRFDDAAIYRRSIGTLWFSPRLASVLGAQGGHVRIAGAGTTAAFDLTVANELQIRNLELVAPVRSRILGNLVEGTVEIRGATLSLGISGDCIAAEGQVETDLFDGAFSMLGLARRPVLADLSCEDKLLGFGVVRNLDGGVLQVDSRLAGPALLRLDIQLRFDDQASMPQQWGQLLGQNGFQATENGWRTSVRVPL